MGGEEGGRVLCLSYTFLGIAWVLDAAALSEAEGAPEC